MDVWDHIATERRRLADDLEALNDEQWRTQSQCDAWNVHQAAAHIVMPLTMSTGQFFGGLLRSGFRPNAMVQRATARVADELSPAQVIQRLRDEAGNRWTPSVPGLGAEVPLSEVVVHGQDIRRPLGIDCTVPQATIDLTLEGIKNDKTRADYQRRIGV